MTGSKIVSSVRHYAENVILELQVLIDESLEETVDAKELVTKFERLSQKISKETKKAVALTDSLLDKKNRYNLNLAQYFDELWFPSPSEL